MCSTCNYCIAKYTDKSLVCVCTQSEFYRDAVCAEHICDCYEEQPRELCARDRGTTCEALVDKNCEGCRFYITMENLRSAQKNSVRRIRKLPREKRNAIKETYKLNF